MRPGLSFCNDVLRSFRILQLLRNDDTVLLGLTLLRISSEELIVREQPPVQLSQRVTQSAEQSSQSQSSNSSSSTRPPVASSRSDAQSQSSQSQGGLCLSQDRKTQLYEAFVAYVPQALELLQQRLSRISNNASTPHPPQQIPDSFSEPRTVYL